jgi:hypothetical protein
VAFADVEVVAEGMKPLQSPLLQVLYAHWSSVVQLAWKFPHLVINIEFTA